MARPRGTLITITPRIAILLERAPFGRSERGSVGEGPLLQERGSGPSVPRLPRLPMGFLPDQDNG